MSSCRGVNCGCKDYARKSTLSAGWVVCAHCFHAEQTHVFAEGEKPAIQRTDGTVKEAPKTYKIKSVTKSTPTNSEALESPAVASGGTLEPKAMRAWLIANGVDGVGARGRLKPEHISLAKKMLASENKSS